MGRCPLRRLSDKDYDSAEKQENGRGKTLLYNIPTFGFGQNHAGYKDALEHREQSALAVGRDL